FVAFDSSGVITDWNPQCEALFGWLRSEAIGRKLVPMLFPPEPHSSGIDGFLATWDRPESRRHIELTGMRKDGHRFPVEISLFSFRIGDRLSFAAFIRDVSSRRQVEDDLRQSDVVLRSILENSSDMVFVKDLRLKYLLANQTTAKMFGVPVE